MKYTFDESISIFSSFMTASHAIACLVLSFYPNDLFLEKLDIHLMLLIFNGLVQSASLYLDYQNNDE